MAFVIPIAASFAAASAASVTIGAALTGAAGFATFATVAGGFMASAGMLTKNKTLQKIGSIVGLVGAVSSLASSLSGAATKGATEGATAAAGEAAKEGATGALQNELANTAVGETIGQVGSEAATQAGSEAAGQLGTQSLGSFADAASSGAGGALTLDPNGLGGGNLMDLARAGGGGSDYGLMQRGLESASVATDYAQDQALGKIAEAGAQFKDQSALQSMLDKLSSAGKWAKDNMSTAGKWAKDNKELLTAGGTLLNTGLQSMQQGQQFDEQMNLLEARRRRLNQPVALGTQSAQPIRIGG